MKRWSGERKEKKKSARLDDPTRGEEGTGEDPGIFLSSLGALTLVEINHPLGNNSGTLELL